LCGALIRGEDDLEGLERLFKAGEWHGLAGIQSIEKSLELALIRMIAHIAAIEHFHVQLAPGSFVRVQLHGVKFVIQQAALAAAEVGVEVVWLEAVHDGGGFAHSAVFEVQDGHAGGVVFIGLEDITLRLGGERAHTLHLTAHHHQQGIQCMAACGEECAAAVFLAGVPAELPIPWADAVVVVHLAIVQAAEQAFIEQGFGDLELIGEAALEAYAAFDAVGFRGGGDFTHFLQGVGHRFFENDVLLRIRSGDGLIAVLARVAGDVHHMDARVSEYGIDALVALDLAAVLGAELRVIQLAGGVDRRDLALGGFVDCLDVSSGCPAISDNADVVFFHG
jgi:hypothetical protein